VTHVCYLDPNFTACEQPLPFPSPARVPAAFGRDIMKYCSHGYGALLVQQALALHMQSGFSQQVSKTWPIRGLT
jgi:hypothetical protein